MIEKAVVGEIYRLNTNGARRSSDGDKFGAKGQSVRCVKDSEGPFGLNYQKFVILSPRIGQWNDNTDQGFSLELARLDVLAS